MKRTTIVSSFIAGLVIAGSILLAVQPDLATRARAALAQHKGSIILSGIREPVEILRDKWGVPHIYARNTTDLFFAQFRTNTGGNIH